MKDFRRKSLSLFNWILRFAQDRICYLLYLFVFLIPWQIRWIIWDPQINAGTWEYGRISLYAFDVIFIFLLILFLFNINNIKIKNFKLILLAVIFFIFNFIIADDKLINFYWLLRILQGVLLVWILSKINFSKIKLVASFIASMTLSASFGIYQFLTQSAFANKWLGLAMHSASELGHSVIETGSERWLRAYGSFSHPNILAGFLVVAIIFCLWLLNKKEYKNIKLLLVIGCYLLIVALFFTFSRASLLIFLVIIFYYIFFKKNKFIPITCLLLIIFLSIMYLPLVKTRIIGNERLEVKSNIERISGYNQAFKIIKNNILLGTGIGNYTVELQKTYPNQPAYFYQPVHNIYLLVLAEIGLMGVILFFIILYIKHYNYKIIFLYFSIILFLFFFDHFWWTLPSGILLVFVIFSTLDRKVLEM